MNKHLIVLVGPTGIGKTSVGIKIAQHFNSQIISSDSRQIFKELNIGTAVPSRNELKTVKHHFIHSHSIHQNYNASKFEFEALDLINRLFIDKEHLLMVGGSMLYVDAVCKGIDVMPDIDPQIRHELKTRFEKNGIEELRLQLKKLDPEYYKIVDLKNPARIIHALELCIMTGKTFTSFRSYPKKKRPFNIIKVGLNCERSILHNRINKRVDLMVKAGLEKEAQSVYKYKGLTSLNTVGYKEWFSYFDGEISKDKAIDLIKRNSRRYARKQITWFRKDETLKWFEPSETNKIIAFLNKEIKHEKQS